MTGTGAPPVGTVDVPDDAAEDEPGKVHPRYIPALDGMRAFAVGGVLLYHAGVSWMPGGFLGVDAFFVLSGFLITSLLVSEWANRGRIALGAFWARRARRLLPALFLVLGGVALYAAVFAAAQELDTVRRDSLASLGYVANWRFVASGASYFDQFTVPSPLKHMWSLAIEEQFYLIWPLVVVAVLKVFKGSLTALTAVASFLAVTSATLMIWMYTPGEDPSRVYYGTDTRAQSVLIGALIALVAGGVPILRKTAFLAVVHRLALAAFVLLGLVWVTTSDAQDWLYQGGLTISALLVALVIVSVVQPAPTPLSSMLSLAPLVWIGKISYGLYLWHWPIYLVMTSDRTGMSGTTLVLARIGVSVVFAAASFYLVERPIRFGSMPKWRAWTLGPAAALVVVVAIVMTTSGARVSSAAAALSELSAQGDAPDATGFQTRNAETDPTKVMVVGDSVAATLSLNLGANPDEKLWVWNRGSLGCGIARRGSVVVGGDLEAQSTTCDEWPTRWKQYVDEFDPDVVVLLGAAWDMVDRKIDETWYRLGEPAFADYYLSELEEARNVLSSNGAQVVLLTSPYFSPTEQVRDPSRDWSEFEPWRVDILNQIYRTRALHDLGGMRIVDLNKYVSPGGQFSDTLDGVLIRDDGVHFTREGSAYVSQWLAPQLRQIGLENVEAEDEVRAAAR